MSFEIQTSSTAAGPLLATPTQWNLMNCVAAEIPAKWKVVGIQLRLSSGTLDSIQSENAGKPQADLLSFEQVLSKWERQGPSPYTWQTITEVLRTPSVGEVALAERLHKKYANYGSGPKNL